MGVGMMEKKMVSYFMELACSLLDPGGRGVWEMGVGKVEEKRVSYFM
jgi:hypothetical protein